jgi:hypothetical protein
MRRIDVRGSNWSRFLGRRIQGVSLQVDFILKRLLLIAAQRIARLLAIGLGAWTRLHL